MIAKEVKEQTQNPRHWRPHPEVPHLAKATQYWSLVKQGLKKELERIKSQRVDWTADVDADTGRKLSSQMAADMGTNVLSEGVAAAPQAVVPAAPQPEAAQDPALIAAQETLRAQQAAAAEKERQAQATKRSSRDQEATGKISARQIKESSKLPTPAKRRHNSKICKPLQTVARLMAAQRRQRS